MKSFLHLNTYKINLSKVIIVSLLIVLPFTVLLAVLNTISTDIAEKSIKANESLIAKNYVVLKKNDSVLMQEKFGWSFGEKYKSQFAHFNYVTDANGNNDLYFDCSDLFLENVLKANTPCVTRPSRQGNSEQHLVDEFYLTIHKDTENPSFLILTPLPHDIGGPFAGLKTAPPKITKEIKIASGENIKILLYDYGNGSYYVNTRDLGGIKAGPNSVWNKIQLWGRINSKADEEKMLDILSSLRIS